MATLTAVPAGGDAEHQTGFLFSLLHNYLPESPVAAVEPPDLDVAVCHAMQRVLAMGHNRALARRVHAEVRRAATAAGAGSPAARAQATVELVFNVIMETAAPAAYATTPPLGPEGRRVLLAAFDRVGVYARDDPFPAVVTVPCERRTNCRIFTDENEPVPNPNGGYDFEVLRPVSGAAGMGSGNGKSGGGLYSGSGRCYALVRKLKKAIYGSVQLAHVIRVESAAAPNSESKDASGVVLRWTEERVAVKCISKAAVLRMQRSGKPMNENPLKEVRCLAYLTRRMNGTLAGPEVVRGDPRRVLPMVDCLEDDEGIYLVMPCLAREMFSVVEARGGPFPEPEACAILSQIVDGLEVAHSLGLAHHDMSLENLMTDASGGAVIIDWGMVVKVALTDRGIPVKVASRDSWPCKCGKLLYTAPEILTATEASPAFDPLKLDVWALGIMLFVLLTGVPPWSVESGPTPEDARFQHVTRGQLQALLNAWSINLSPPAVQLLQALLLGNPNKRPTVAEVRHFSWFISGGQT